MKKAHYLIEKIGILLCILLVVCNGTGKAQRVAAGSSSTIFLKNDSTAWVCGNSGGGQSDGTAEGRVTTVQIKNLTGVIAVSRSNYFTLFLKSDGTVWGCGSNGNGQLGLGTTSSTQVTPVQTIGLTNIVAIAAGDYHALFLKSDGTVWSCGYNTQGALGDGTTTQRTTPVQVPGLSNVKKIAATRFSSRALKEDGTVWVWGSNGAGLMGLPSYSTNVLSPMQLSSISGVVDMAFNGAGDFGFYIKKDGSVWGHGYNAEGELGDGTFTGRTTPVRTLIDNVLKVCAGTQSAFFIKKDGTLWACGCNEGQFALGNLDNIATPVQLGITGVTEVGGGAYHAAYLKSDGSVMSCGRNVNWALGDGTSTTSTTFVTTREGITGTGLAAGGNHSIFISKDSTVYMAGANAYGQLGDGTVSDRTIAVKPAGVGQVMAAAAGAEHSLLLKSDGTVWACGRNNYGQLGDGTTTDRSTPVMIPSLTGVKAIAAGSSHSLFLKNDGTVWACGYNNAGQLGNGTTVNSSTPVMVSGSGSIMAIAAGIAHSLFIKTDSTVWGCGLNADGQLGTGGNANALTLTQAVGLTSIMAIATKGSHSLFLKSDKTVWTCGLNSSGQLATNNTVSRNQAQQVIYIDNVTAIAAGYSHSLFLKSDGTAYASGSGSSGQLATSSTADRLTPRIIGFPFGSYTIAGLAAGGNHTLLLTSGGRPWSAGSNVSGCLSDGSTTLRSGPVYADVGLPLNIGTVIATPQYKWSCTGDETSLGSLPSGGAWSTTDVSVATVNASGTITFLSAGTARITYTINGTKAITTIKVTTSPTAGATNSGPVCPGNSVTLNSTASGAGPFTYRWSGPGVFAATVGTAQITSASLASAGIYTLVVSDTLACTDTAVTSVAIHTPPIIVSTTSNAPVCVGKQLDLSGSATGGSGSLHYAWSGPGGYTATGGSPSITSAAVATAGTYTMIVTDANSCTDTAGTGVVIRALPLISFVSNSGPVCSGVSFALTSTAGSAVNPLSYVWHGPAGFSSTDVSPVVASPGIDAGGAYTVTVTDGNNCVSTATTSVTVHGVPAIDSIGNTGPLCAGSTLVVNGAATGGTGALRYAWTGPATFTATTQSAAIPSGPAAAGGNYTLVVSDDNSCNDTAVTIAVIYARPVIAAIGNSGPVCSGISFALSSTAGSAATPLSYLWDGPAGFTSTEASPVVASPGIDAGGAYTVTVTDGNNCVATATTSVTVHGVPVIDSVDNTGPLCAGSTLVVNGAATGGTGALRYAWTGPASFAATTQSAAIPSAPTAAGGDYTLVVSDDNSCADTAVTTALIYTLPAIAAIGNSAPVCEDHPLSLFSSITGGAGSYSWAWSGPNGFSSRNEDPLVSSAVTASANGVYSLVVTDANNCVATGAATTAVTVYPQQPIVGSATVLFGQVTILGNPVPGGTWTTSTPWITGANPTSGMVKGVSAGVSEISYTTSFGCVATHTMTVLSGTNVCVGQSITISDGATGGIWSSNSGSLATVVTATGMVTGVSAGKAIITHRLATGAIITTTVTVHPLAATTAAPASVCQGLTLTLANGTVGGGTWYSGNTSTAVVSGSGIVTGVTGGAVTMYFTPLAGCVTVKTVTIIPTPAITGTMNVCMGQTTALSNSGAGGVWSTSSGSLATVSAMGVVKGIAAGAPRISYIWPTGCWTTATVAVNPISPNTTATGELVCAGKSIAYTNATPGGGAWSSSNTGIATVTGTGSITGVSGGIAQISFTTPLGCVATKSVTVRVTPSVSGTASVCAGQTGAMSNSISGGAWSTSSGSVATVSAAGVVSAVSAGTARISYMLTTGCYDFETVTVNALSPITGGMSGMCQGGSMTLANATPFGGVWSSSNSAAATVSATGVVRGSSPGVAIISFTSNVAGCVATKTINVNACRQSSTTSVGDVAEELGEIQLFPNPNNGSFTVKGAIDVFDGDVAIRVTNVLGQSVFSSAATIYDGRLEQQIILPANLADGTYLLTLSSATGRKEYHFVVAH